jgi:transposase
MRKTYVKDFKAKLALEALRGDKTIQELGQTYQVHPNLITQWKKPLLDNASNVFERASKIPVEISEIEEKRSILFQEVGQLQVENRFLKKSTRNCTDPEPKLSKSDYGTTVKWNNCDPKTGQANYAPGWAKGHLSG